MKRPLIHTIFTVALILLTGTAYAVTVRTVTVKTSGGDYTSLNAALQGEAADLVSADRQLNIECYSMVDNVAVSVASDTYTTDATRYVNIYAATGHRHSGKRDATKYILTVGGSTRAAGFVHVQHLRLDGLQIEYDGSNSGSPESLSISTNYSQHGASDIRVSNLFIRNNNTAYSAQGFFLLSCGANGFSVLYVEYGHTGDWSRQLWGRAYYKPSACIGVYVQLGSEGGGFYSRCCLETKCWGRILR